MHGGIVFVFDGDGEVAVADEGAQGAQFRVAGDEGREGRIGAFDEAHKAAVADPRRPGGHVVDEDGERCWQVVHCTIRQEGDELAERPSGFGCGEQRVGAYGPDSVAGVLGVGVEDEPVGGGGVADGDDVQGRQDLQGPFRLRGAGGWLVAAGQPECVGSTTSAPAAAIAVRRVSLNASAPRVISAPLPQPGNACRPKPAGRSTLRSVAAR